MQPCLALSNIGYLSRLKWSNPGKGIAPPLYLDVVAIEKGAFGLPSTTGTKFTYFLLLRQYWYYLTQRWENKEIHTFNKRVAPKLNVTARLELELT